MVNKKMVQVGSEKSVIRSLYEEANEQAHLGTKTVFDFTLGNPSVLPPNEINETICQLVKNEPDNIHAYTSSCGRFDTRKSIVAELNHRFDVVEDPNLMYLTMGAASSLTITFHAILNPFEEVIVLSPYFPEYRVFIEKAGGICKEVITDSKTFLPNIDLIKHSITPMTKAIVINSPNNPTGVVYSESIIQELSFVLKEKENEFGHDIYLISDEPYREVIFNGLQYPFVTKYYDNTILCYSYSKSLSLPGERIGYILVGHGMHEKEQVYLAICGSARTLGFVCAPSLFQGVLKECATCQSDVSRYELNKELLYPNLIRMGYEVVKPLGAFYLFVKALEEDAVKFSNVCKKFGLYVVPSDSFGIKGYVRIAYCVKYETIKNSLLAFQKVYDYYQ